MPDLFTARHISEAEYRLRLLYSVNVLGPVTREQLWPFLARLDLMDYMPMCQFLYELKRDGALEEGVLAARGVLALSGEGQRTLQLFEDRLPINDRERITREAPGYVASLREKRQVRMGYERAPSGRSRICCRVTEGELPTLTIRLESGDAGFTSAAMKAFPAAASAILAFLYTLPDRGEALGPALPVAADMETALAKAQPGAAYLCVFGKREVAAAVYAAQGEETMRVALLLPSQRHARIWAAAAMRPEKRLFATVSRLLKGDGAQ